MTTIELEQNSPWLTTEEAEIYWKVSRRTLSRYMKKLTYGIQYKRTNPSNRRSPIQWHIIKFDKWLCTPQAVLAL